LAEVDAREAARQEAAHAANSAQDISAREMHLISLADAADLPKSAAVDEDKICVICHEDLMSGRRLAATECGHVFCAGCIGMSLRHNDACPTCRVVEPTVTLLYI
jgi:formylmethanofuran dehydrogenase subunit E